jgi:hypothetical protein
MIVAHRSALETPGRGAGGVGYWTLGEFHQGARRGKSHRRGPEKPHAQSRTIRRLMILMGCLAVSACTPLERRDAVPEPLHDQARVPLRDVDGAIRYRMGNARDQQLLAQAFVDSWRASAVGSNFPRKRAPCPIRPSSRFPAAGDQGAFGAGLLVGWTAAGTRTAIQTVTGSAPAR